MTHAMTPATPLPRLAIASLCAALVAGLALAAGPASAWPEDRATAAHRVRDHGRNRLVTAPPPYPGAAIVSGYLPRNHNVPMYNEPPPRGPRW